MGVARNTGSAAAGIPALAQPESSKSDIKLLASTKSREKRPWLAITFDNMTDHPAAIYFINMVVVLTNLAYAKIPYVLNRALASLYPQVSID